MIIVLFDDATLGSARQTSGDLFWYIASNGAVYDVSRQDLMRDPFVSSRPAIFPDLEQALATMPVDDPRLVWLTQNPSVPEP